MNDIHCLHFEDEPELQKKLATYLEQAWKSVCQRHNGTLSESEKLGTLSIYPQSDPLKAIHEISKNGSRYHLLVVDLLEAISPGEKKFETSGIRVVEAARVENFPLGIMAISRAEQEDEFVGIKEEFEEIAKLPEAGPFGTYGMSYLEKARLFNKAAIKIPTLGDIMFHVMVDANAIHMPADVLGIGSSGRKSMSIDIFISHSHEDKKIAKALADLLKSACHLRAEQIRCTSVDGYKLNIGANAEETLKMELNDSRVFIGLVTPKSMKSTYVLFELGARWGAQRHLLPVVAGGFEFKDLHAPLSSYHAADCSLSADVQQLIANVARTLGVQPEPAHTYDAEVQMLVEASRSTGTD